MHKRNRSTEISLNGPIGVTAEAIEQRLSTEPFNSIEWLTTLTPVTELTVRFGDCDHTERHHPDESGRMNRSFRYHGPWISQGGCCSSADASPNEGDNSSCLSPLEGASTPGGVQHGDVLRFGAELRHDDAGRRSFD